MLYSTMSGFYSGVFGEYINSGYIDIEQSLSHIWYTVQLAYLIHIKNAKSDLNMLIHKCSENYRFMNNGLLSFSFTFDGKFVNVAAKFNGEEWTILS